jgi:hypothetical protein
VGSEDGLPIKSSDGTEVAFRCPNLEKADPKR